MKSISLFAASALTFLIVVLAPIPASAQFGGFSAFFNLGPGISFGGQVVSVTPCLGPNLYVLVRSSRVATYGAIEPYVWTPFTLTKLYGPPLTPGQQILGTAGAPITCSFPSIDPRVGLRMQMVGTSIPGSFFGGLF